MDYSSDDILGSDLLGSIAPSSREQAWNAAYREFLEAHHQCLALITADEGEFTEARPVVLHLAAQRRRERAVGRIQRIRCDTLHLFRMKKQVLSVFAACVGPENLVAGRSAISLERDAAVLIHRSDLDAARKHVARRQASQILSAVPRVLSLVGIFPALRRKPGRSQNS